MAYGPFTKKAHLVQSYLITFHDLDLPMSEVMPYVIAHQLTGVVALADMIALDLEAQLYDAAH